MNHRPVEGLETKYFSHIDDVTPRGSQNKLRLVVTQLIFFPLFGAVFNQSNYYKLLRLYTEVFDLNLAGVKNYAAQRNFTPFSVIK